MLSISETIKLYRKKKKMFSQVSVLKSYFTNQMKVVNYRKKCFVYYFGIITNKL